MSGPSKIAGSAMALAKWWEYHHNCQHGAGLDSHPTDELKDCIDPLCHAAADVIRSARAACVVPML